MTNIKVLSQTQRVVVGQGVSKITALTAKNEQITITQARASVSVINAGPIGATGVQGLQGPSTLPVGTVLDYAGAAAPSGFLMLDGSTVTNGQTTYADLWAVIPAGWKSGANIILPDARGRATIGAGTGSGLTARTLGANGGVESVTLSAAQSGIAQHSHGPGSHTHSINHDHGSYSESGASLINSGSVWADGGASSTRGFETATVNVPSFTGTSGTPSANNTADAGPTAASTAHDNMQPWLALNKIIRAIP